MDQRRRWVVPAVAAGTLIVILGLVHLLSSGLTIQGCAVAAEHIMVANSYSESELLGISPNDIPACKGLDANQYYQALTKAEEIEYGPFQG